MDLNLSEYLKVYQQFQLGGLSTEGFHPMTKDLTNLSKTNLPNAFACLKDVDLKALSQLSHKLPRVFELHQNIWKTLKAGNKIFLSGCGATGRLSLALETLFRITFKDEKYSDQICSFMAGGDVALIKSIESFEDNAQYGQRQLTELGFKKGDLLIASTEGGETTFVLSTALEAAQISPNNSYLLYCNPDTQLRKIHRSAQALGDEGIKKIELSHGQQALSGSTRMQASSILMWAIGLALLSKEGLYDQIKLRYKLFYSYLQNFNYQILEPLTQWESEKYLNNEQVLYETDEYLGISILTDTTERSPTFSLNAFENFSENDPDSIVYMTLNFHDTADQAWKALLWREPRCLDWDEVKHLTEYKRLMGFDISFNGEKLRKKKAYQNILSIKLINDLIDVSSRDFNIGIDVSKLELLEVHLILKLLLNAHSTITMARNDRTIDNMMSWVKPSNLKLIDRSIRYIRQILKNRNIEVEYEVCAKKVFELMKDLKGNESIVLKAVESFST